MAGQVMPDGYSYYWHGYVVLLRPLLLFINYADMRVVNQLLQLLSVVVLACLLYRREGFPWAILSVSIYGLLLPMAISQALQYSWVFYIGLFGSLLIVRFHDWFSQKERVYFLFLLLGMLTCYMDLLTYPLFTWGIPMIWWLVMNRNNEEGRKLFASVIFCGIAWICGYGGLWIGKWLIGQVILHQPLLQQAWHEVQYRSGTLPDVDGTGISHIKVIWDNLSIYQSIQSLFLLGGWIIWLGYRFTIKHINIKVKNASALLLVSLSPVVWYIILHNHTYVHSSFTYRIWVIGLTALLALLINATDVVGSAPCDHKRIFPIMMAIVAMVIALNIREETYVHNGNIVPQQLELSEDMEITQEFTPTYKIISAINLLLYAENGQSGEIRVRFMEENQIIEEWTISAREVEGGVFYELPIAIQLKNNSVYRFGISVNDLADNRIFVGMTDAGNCPLAELSELQISKEAYDAQLICGIRYQHRVDLRKQLFFVELQLLVYWNFCIMIKRILWRNK